MKYNKYKILTRENWIDFYSDKPRSITNKLRNVINNTNIKTTELFYMYKNNIYETPLCLCGNKLKFLGISDGYRKHCSNKCSKLDSKTQEKYENTMFNRYGTISTFGFDKTREKIQNTINNYLILNPNYRNEMNDKKIATCLERYGVKYTFQTKELYIKSRKTQESIGRWVPSNKKLDFELYKMLVWKYTYRNNLNLLENFHKRGRSDLCEDAHHIDHIIPIIYGFNNNILPHIIGGMKNLQMLHYKENCSKGGNYIKTKE